MPHRPCRPRRANAHQHGFTLVEMVIVIAIAGILAAAAYPVYVDHVRKSRRADAQAVLMEAAAFMERFYTESMRYDQSAAGAPVALPAGVSESPRDGTSRHYTISIETVGQRDYQLLATPQGRQASDDCGPLRINQSGARTAALASCWSR